MKTKLAALAAGVVVLVLAASAPAQGRPSPEQQVQDTINSLARDIAEAKDLAALVSDKTLRSKMEKNIARMEVRLEELQKQLGGIITVPNPTAISDADFNKLLKAVKGEAFDDKKVTLIKDFLRAGAFFNSGQMIKLLKEVKGGDAQVDTVVLLAQRMTDQQNINDVIDAVTFNSDKEKIRQQLRIK
jgi:septal ring factor EnvC (AmiA/AmiB activator)